mmetsp:Transcript_4332/g.10580  ORF Transcript_4332/g.10580 Transcript_4332/m.10580 type:complete len:244 (+) Transcript_4332:419-1150(+)
MLGEASVSSPAIRLGGISVSDCAAELAMLLLPARPVAASFSAKFSRRIRSRILFARPSSLFFCSNFSCISFRSAASRCCLASCSSSRDTESVSSTVRSSDLLPFRLLVPRRFSAGFCSAAFPAAAPAEEVLTAPVSLFTPSCSSSALFCRMLLRACTASGAIALVTAAGATPVDVLIWWLAQLLLTDTPLSLRAERGLSIADPPVTPSWYARKRFSGCRSWFRVDWKLVAPGDWKLVVQLLAA